MDQNTSYTQEKNMRTYHVVPSRNTINKINLKCKIKYDKTYSYQLKYITFIKKRHKLETGHAKYIQTCIT
jgi:hypothetical protein